MNRRSFAVPSRSKTRFRFVGHRMLAWLFRRLTLLVIALGPQFAFALDIGTLHWKAVSGQAPSVIVELNDKTTIDTAVIKARIAPREAYAAAGLTYDPGLATVELVPQIGPDGHAVLRLDRLPANAQTLDLLIVVNNHVSLKLAEYRIDLRLESGDVPPSPAGTLQFKSRAAGPAKPENPAPVKQIKLDDAAESVRSAVQAWAEAWSRRDVDAYLAAYTPDYAGAEAKGSRQAWVEQRRERILARNKISVVLKNLRVERCGDTFVVDFEQRYQSDGPADRVRKRLTLVSDNGRWLIKREVALPRPAAPVQSNISQAEENP
jgi:ketosteroid isomerase-like protein